MIKRDFNIKFKLRNYIFKNFVKSDIVWSINNTNVTKRLHMYLLSFNILTLKVQNLKRKSIVNI